MRKRNRKIPKERWSRAKEEKKATKVTGKDMDNTSEDDKKKSDK